MPHFPLTTTTTSSKNGLSPPHTPHVLLHTTAVTPLRPDASELRSEPARWLSSPIALGTGHFLLLVISGSYEVTVPLNLLEGMWN